MNNIDELLQEIQALKNRNQELEHKLQKYTNSDGHKRYYEKNKDVVKEKGKSYLHKLKEENPEKLKEYRRTAYLNRKLKLQNTMTENISNDETNLK
jgi:predicted  nucleic acid-binding Zn-ribbon protein